MIRARQGTHTEPPSLERKSGGRGAQGLRDKDPLEDTTSHASRISPETLRGGNTVAKKGQRPNQTEEVPLAALGL